MYAFSPFSVRSQAGIYPRFNDTWYVVEIIIESAVRAGSVKSPSR